MLSPRNVLDEAHHQAVLFARLDNDSGDLRMAKGAVGLEPALAADKIELPAGLPALGMIVIGRLRPRCSMLRTIPSKVFRFLARGLVTVILSSGTWTMCGECLALIGCSPVEREQPSRTVGRVSRSERNRGQDRCARRFANVAPGSSTRGKM